MNEEFIIAYNEDGDEMHLGFLTRCKDCLCFTQFKNDDEGICKITWEQYHKDFYCAYAERRTTNEND